MITKRDIVRNPDSGYRVFVWGQGDAPRVGDYGDSNGTVCTNISYDSEGGWLAEYESQKCIDARKSFDDSAYANRLSNAMLDGMETDFTFKNNKLYLSKNVDAQGYASAKVGSTLELPKPKNKPKPKYETHDFKKSENAYDQRKAEYNKKPSVDNAHIGVRIWGWLGFLTTAAGLIGWAVKVYGWVQ